MDLDQKQKCNRSKKGFFYVLILTVILLLTSSIGSSETNVSTIQRGIDFVNLKLYPEAVETFESILTQNPNDSDALYQLANVYRLQDDLASALDTAEKIISDTETTNRSSKGRLIGFTHLLLSEIYCKQSKLDIAERHAIEAVQRCADVADMHYRLGYIYTHQARFDKALPAFKRTLSLKPDFAEVHQWLGLIALMQKKPKEAVAHYKNAIQRKPYVQSAYYNLAKAYRLLGDMDAASEQLKLFRQMKSYYDKTYAIEDVLSEEPSNALLRLKLAEIHIQHKNISAVIATYQALIRVNPKFSKSYDKLGRLYMKLNMSQKAIPLFLKVIELDPNSVEAHVRLGWLYNLQKSYQKAESHLHKAIEMMPKHTLAYHGLAEIHVQKGEIQKAMQVYKQITKIDPNDNDAWSALRKLEHAKKGAVTK